MKATFATLIVSLLLALAYTQSCNAVADKFLAAIKYGNPNNSMTSQCHTCGPGATCLSGYCTDKGISYSYCRGGVCIGNLFYWNVYCMGVATCYAKVTSDSPISPSATPFEVCDEFWSIAGTCCYEDGMKAVYTSKTENIKKGWDNFIKGAYNVNGMLSKLKSMSANRYTVNADLTTAKTLIPDKFEGLTPEQGAVLIDKVNEFSVQYAEFGAEAKTCFNLLMKARGIAFCYGCSAYAAHKAYFSATDGKFTISQASRLSIAAACIKPWAFIYGLRGMMQMFAILSWQRDPTITAFQQTLSGGLHYGGVTGPLLYEAFIACLTATVGGACTQATIDLIVVSQFNLFDGEKYATDVNTNYPASQPVRLLAVTSTATGDIAIGATPTVGADLIMTVKNLPYAPMFNTSNPTANSINSSNTNASSLGFTSSSRIIYFMISIVTAGVIYTLN